MSPERAKREQSKDRRIAKAPIPVLLLTGTRLRLLFANPAAVTIFGKAVETLINKEIELALPLLFSDIEIRSIIATVLSSGESWTSAKKHLDVPDPTYGSRNWFNVRCEQVSDDESQEKLVACYFTH